MSPCGAREPTGRYSWEGGGGGGGGEREGEEGEGRRTESKEDWEGAREGGERVIKNDRMRSNQESAREEE